MGDSTSFFICSILLNTKAIVNSKQAAQTFAVSVGDVNKMQRSQADSWLV